MYTGVYMKTIILLASLLLSSFSLLSAQETPVPSEAPIRVIPHAEIGFVAILEHIYRSGSTAMGNSNFNFVKQGGQDILFPFSRFTVDVIASQHRFSALYQPLTIKTQTVAGRNATGTVKIDNTDFGTKPINITYGFDFFRLSYLYDFLPQPNSELGIGLSFQLRNVNVDFTSVDGLDRTVQNNVGLVPIIKIKAAHRPNAAFGIDFEADGFYASSAIFNGAGKPFEGWIWDAALRIKTRIIDNSSAFLSIRSIGGGSSGTSAYDRLTATNSSSGEGYNALATMAVTLGVSLNDL